MKSSSDMGLPAGDANVSLLRHLAFERLSPQWAGFLRVLGQALQAQLSVQELKLFLRRLGELFAQAHPLAATATLAELEELINRFWFERQWGYASLEDRGDALVIQHRGCPLPAALQTDTEVAAAFLEGCYGQWLVAAGAPAELTMRSLPPTDWPMHMAFEFGPR